MTPFCSVLIKPLFPHLLFLFLGTKERKTNSLWEQKERVMTAREAIKSWHHKKSDRVTTKQGRHQDSRQETVFQRLALSHILKREEASASPLQQTAPPAPDGAPIPARDKTSKILHLLKIDTDASRLQHQHRHCKILNTTEDCSQTDSSQWCPHTPWAAPWAIRLRELLKAFPYMANKREKTIAPCPLWASLLPY